MEAFLLLKNLFGMIIPIRVSLRYHLEQLFQIRKRNYANKLKSIFYESFS